MADAGPNAFDFGQPCRFRLNGDMGCEIVEYMFVGGSRRCGMPPIEMGG